MISYSVFLSKKTDWKKVYTRIFRVYKKKETGFVAKFFVANPKLYVPRSRNQLKLSINKTKVVGPF